MWGEWVYVPLQVIEVKAILYITWYITRYIIWCLEESVGPLSSEGESEGRRKEGREGGSTGGQCLE